MSQPFDRELAGIERRLERRVAKPSPALRHRVLMAVDDVLVAQPPQPPAGHRPAVFGWVSAAVAAGIAAVAATGLMPRGFLHDSAPPLLVTRLRAVGLADAGLLAAAGPTPTAGLPPSAAADAPPSLVPASDSRPLLHNRLEHLLRENL